MMQWSWSAAPPSDEAEEAEDIISGSYSHSFLPHGKYSMEIIVLMCSEIKYEEDFQNICLEDPSNHRITMDDAFIEVEEVLNHHMSDGDVDADSSLGQWVYDNNRTRKLPLDEKVEEHDAAPIITPPPSNLSHLSSPPPLHTRYQPPNCGKDWRNHKRCIPMVSTDRFEPYRFEWNKESYNYVYLNAKDDLVNKNTTSTAKGIETVVCAVGASHSRELVEYFNYHLENSVRVVSSSTLLSNQHQTNITTNITANTTQSSSNSTAATTALPIITPPEKKPTVKVVHAGAQYPTDVTEGFVKRKIKWQSCTHIVIGLGQWPASYKGGQPTLFPDFEEQMIQAIDNIKKVQKNNPKIYLRSLHSDSIK